MSSPARHLTRFVDPHPSCPREPHRLPPPLKFSRSTGNLVMLGDVLLPAWCARHFRCRVESLPCGPPLRCGRGYATSGPVGIFHLTVNATCRQSVIDSCPVPREVKVSDVFNNPTFGPYTDEAGSGSVQFMSLFFEYVTSRSAGWSRMDSVTIPDAVAEATRALRGLACISATLRHAPAANHAFGDGTVLAEYTPLEGWSVHEGGTVAKPVSDASSSILHRGPSPGFTRRAPSKYWP